MSPLFYLLIVPLCGIFLMFWQKGMERKIAFGVAAINFLITLVLYIIYFFSVEKHGGGFTFESQIPWIDIHGFPPITFHVGVDGISLPLLLLTTLVTLCSFWVKPSASSSESKSPFFYGGILLISMGAIGAFISLDLFFIYIFHEFALIPTFLIMGFWGSENRKFLATQLTLYLMLGSLILLVGVLGLVWMMPPELRTFDVPTMYSTFKNNTALVSHQTFVFSILFIGFGVLVSLFPFYSWAPRAYANAPTPVTMLHAGVLKKFGIYGLLRVAIPLLPVGMQMAQTWIGVLLVCNILFVGYVTVSQKKLGDMIGYSSVMHMGYLFLGLVAWNVIGVSGVVLLMVAHGLSASLLFAITNKLYEKTGEKKMENMGGLAQRMPFLSVCFLIASLAAIGLPGLANFSGEILIFFGAWESNLHWMTILCLWGVVISALYQLRAVSSVFFGEMPQAFSELEDINSWEERMPYLLLVVGLLLIGLVPRIILHITQPSIQSLIGG